MLTIQKLKLHNFKRFQDFEVSFDSSTNILIGDNESGKSTILNALELVMSGSRAKIENSGLENLFNKETVADYLTSSKKISNLPSMYVELFLDDVEDFRLNGKLNSEKRDCNGLRLECIPDNTLSDVIAEILKQPEPNFPFEYFEISFYTFSGALYNGYKRFINYVSVDNSKIGSDYALHEYVNGMYESITDNIDRCNHKNKYRKVKDDFNKQVFSEINDATVSSVFGVKSDTKSSLENDLTLFEDGIALEQKGKGRQCFIKTEFALSRAKCNLDVILLEEPENHLSYSNMQKLVREIANSHTSQLFIATHSNMICSRIDLRKVIMLNSSSHTAVLFNALSPGNAMFFMKAPDHSMLEFLLSQLVILVEGDAEYILMSSFFTKVAGKKLDEAGISVIAVDGTSFSRYLEIARFLNIKTAVIRDNDGDPVRNCEKRYSEYESSRIKIFYERKPEWTTLEKCIYRDNKVYCDTLWESSRKTLPVAEYMLKNKTEVAFEIIEHGLDGFFVPSYIQEALLWISE